MRGVNFDVDGFVKDYDALVRAAPGPFYQPTEDAIRHLVEKHMSSIDVEADEYTLKTSVVLSPRLLEQARYPEDAIRLQFERAADETIIKWRTIP